MESTPPAWLLARRNAAVSFRLKSSTDRTVRASGWHEGIELAMPWVVVSFIYCTVENFPPTTWLATAITNFRHINNSPPRRLKLQCTVHRSCRRFDWSNFQLREMATVIH